MDNISYNFIEIEIPDFNPEFFSLWLSAIENKYGVSYGELTFVFCSDDYLLELNKEHLSHDYYTDIITFNFNEESSLSGDIFISYDRVVDNANQFSNRNIFDELCRVMCHGVLHLIGFNDKSDEDQLEMRKNEDLCLNLRKSFT